jgi:hypothetical protein
MLPGSVGDWSPEVLSQQQDTVELDPFFGPAGLGASDRASALSALEAVSDEAIAEAVAGPPDEWGLDAADRIALAGYLAARRVRLLETLT